MFDLDKKLKFYEDEDVMAIEFKWYTPVAFFFLFFTVIWNTFLFFWYTLAFAGGAPLVFILFPMLHVAVGLFLIYFTACQFINKTNIEIDDEYLTIRHSPIPWWRGDIEIPTRNINQLYVKEEVSQGKNGTTYTYSLRAKLNDNSDKEVLSLPGIDNTQMLEFEEELERFIGITDRPVKGEYNVKQDTSPVIGARMQHRFFTESPLGPFYFTEKGEMISLKAEAVKVISVTQLDWNDGNSDKILQLANEKGAERLVYFGQNKAILNVFQEVSLSLADIGFLGFDKNNPPKTIEISNETFQLSDYKTGKKFIIGVAENLDVEQWVYLSEDPQTNIRVINNNGVIHYYKGTQLQVDDFEDTLDLNAPPEQEIRYDEPDWEEGDLV